MNKFIYVITLFALPFILFIQCKHADAESNADIEYLDSLKLVCKTTYVSPDLFLDNAKALKTEAERQNNDLYLGYAYRYMLGYYTMYPEVESLGDSTLLYAQKAKYHFDKANNPEEVLRVDIAYLDWKVSDEEDQSLFGRIFELIAQSEKYKGSDIPIAAYSILGWAYTMSYSPAEAYATFLRKLDLVKNFDNGHNDSERVYDAYIRSYFELATSSFAMLDYDLALSYCDSVEFYLDKHSKEVDRSSWRFSLDLQRLDIYSYAHSIEKGKVIAKNIQSRIDSITPYDMMLVYPVLAEFYFQKKEYGKALEELNRHESLLLEYQLLNNDAVIKNLKARVLAGKKEFEEAYNLKSEFLLYLDSINIKNSTRQLSEMYTLHNVDKLEKEGRKNESQSTHSMMLAFILIIVCISLIIIVFMVKTHNDRLRMKNKEIFDQIQYIDKYRSQINMLKSEKKTEESVSISQDNTLFERIEQYLQNTRCYADPNITRDTLAQGVGTNRQYLIQTIHEEMGMTFNEYILHHRLGYAYERLTREIGPSIEDIYLSAGFIYKSTFYRLFKDKYNLTPREVRDLTIAQLKN